MTTILMIAAVLPALVLVHKVYRADRFEKEPTGLLIKLLVFGILSTLTAIVLEYVGEWILDGFVSYYDPMYNVIYFFIIIAGAEEISKFVFLKLGSFKNSAFNCMFDGIVYAVIVSLGFALFENIMYVFEGGLSVALLRAITAVPAHASFGVFMGIWYGYAKYMQVNKNEKEKLNLVLCVGIPMLIHGAYDYVLSMNSNLVVVIFIAFVVLLFGLSIRLIQNVSKNDFYL